MDELESQIAKIQLGNSKTSSSYVHVMVEKAPVGETELFVVAELPLLNPAAEDDCERICLAIGSTLKRAYRNPAQNNTFENAITLINEELGKLATMGQTQWIYKLNCILAAKDGNNFYVASCGKVSAFLLRNKEYTDISCSPSQSHPLKTFENYAVGKIRLGDLLLLSTTQLFNYLSMDRLMDVVSSNNFLPATQTVIQLLKENSDPQVSFGVVLNLQVTPGDTQEQEIDLENYVVEKSSGQPELLTKAVAYVKALFALDKNKNRVPKVSLPKVSLGQSFKNFSGSAKNLASKGKGFWQFTKNSAQNVKGAANINNFKSLSPVKKFLFASIIILLFAVIANVIIASKVKKTSTQRAQVSSQLKNAQDLLVKAQGSLLYKDYTGAAGFLKQAQGDIPQASLVDNSNKDLYTKVIAQLADTQNQIDRITQASVTNLGSLSTADSLIKLPQYLAAQAKNSIVSYNLQNGKVEDSALTTGGVNIVNSIFISGNLAAIYNGSGLAVWDFSTGKTSPQFTQSVPAQNDFGGSAYYGTNNRVYIVNKKSGQIISFAASKNGFSKPVVSVSDTNLSSALDMTIDTSIYVLNRNGITKYTSGHLADFTITQPSLPLSGSGKIYTQKDFKYIYVLDIGNKRILIFDKKGGLVTTLKSSQFTQLKDFSIDEKNKVAYVLNDGSLLKVTLP